MGFDTRMDCYQEVSDMYEAVQRWCYQEHQRCFRIRQIASELKTAQPAITRSVMTYPHHIACGEERWRCSALLRFTPVVPPNGCSRYPSLEPALGKYIQNEATRSFHASTPFRSRCIHRYRGMHFLGSLLFRAIIQTVCSISMNETRQQRWHFRFLVSPHTSCHTHRKHQTLVSRVLHRFTCSALWYTFIITIPLNSCTLHQSQVASFNGSIHRYR